MRIRKEHKQRRWKVPPAISMWRSRSPRNIGDIKYWFFKKQPGFPSETIEKYTELSRTLDQAEYELDINDLIESNKRNL